MERPSPWRSCLARPEHQETRVLSLGGGAVRLTRAVRRKVGGSTESRAARFFETYKADRLAARRQGRRRLLLSHQGFPAALLLQIGLRLSYRPALRLSSGLALRNFRLTSGLAKRA